MDSIKDPAMRQQILQDISNDAQSLSQLAIGMIQGVNLDNMSDYNQYYHMAYVIRVLESRVKVLAGWTY